MAVDIPGVTYSGAVRAVTIGQGEKAVTVGGETSYPLHLFEGEMPNPPQIALEVCDCEPEGWPASLVAPYADVLASPADWARACVEKYKAGMLCLRLLSTDPNGKDASADDAAAAVKAVADAVDVPLIVWGSENDEKDADVLPKMAEVCQGKRVALGPATEKNYKKVGAAAIAYGHVVVAATPIDINLAKQLNILLGDLGVADDQIIMDLNVGGSSLGYGLEYTYSVMERQRQAALTQQDERLQFPVMCNFGQDVWKKKEVRLEDSAEMGEQAKRGVLIEAVTGWTQVLAGADILVMRHPESVDLLKGMLAEFKV